MALPVPSADVSPDPPRRVRERTLIGRHRASWWLAVAGGLLGLVVVLCLVAGAIGASRTAHIRNDLVDRLYPAETENLRLTTALVDEETGVRGYALTGRADFLAPYEAGRAAEGQALARLGVLARASGADEALPADLALVRRRADAWRAQYAEPVVAEVRSHPGQPLAASRADDGKARFDAVRAALGRQSQGIREARVAARAHLDVAVHRLIVALVVIAIALVAAAIGFAFVVRRAISDPLERLSSEVRQVARGDVRHELTGAGPADIIGLAEDVESMRRRILDELRAAERSREDLERQTFDLARSNAELEQFAYVASHDLQEPLRKVASFCQLLQRRYSGQLDERADQYIDFAVDGAKRMQSLINDLLAFSRVGHTEFAPERVALGEVLADAVDNLTRPIEETRATIEAGALPTVMGERTLLVAVFQNLLGNALKFRGEAAPVVRVQVRQDGKDWIVTCSDDGIGIEPQYAERIFALFQRLHPKESYEGTGIGLSLTRKIVEHHGGRIWLDTESARGTTFRFTLPVAEEPAR
jgi:signal transduction histidine kinase